MMSALIFSVHFASRQKGQERECVQWAKEIAGQARNDGMGVKGEPKAIIFGNDVPRAGTVQTAPFSGNTPHTPRRSRGGAASPRCAPAAA